MSEYFKKNYTKISYIDQVQQTFLDICWPCIFTLNYDSLIENLRKEYESIIPFESINGTFLATSPKLYKLHGDAERFTKTGDKKYCILSRKQYINSITSPQNEDMLRELQTAFASKSIIFIGCSLQEELDLLFVADTHLTEKTVDIDPREQVIIYMSVEDESQRGHDLSPRKIDKLRDYNVTTVLRIFSNTELLQFYQMLLEEKTKHPQTTAIQLLSQFSSIEFLHKGELDVSNRDYLFQEALIWKNIQTHSIVLPSFFTPRNVSKEIISSINSNESSVYFVDGNFYSGKTYCLIDIAKYFTSKKVYLFPSYIHVSDEQLNYLLKQKNTLVCCDSNSLYTSQIKALSSLDVLLSMKKNNTQIVIIIDKSDAAFYKYIFESKQLFSDYKMYSLKSHFIEPSEKDWFNSKIGKLSLPFYKETSSILDFIIKNEKNRDKKAIVTSDFTTPGVDIFDKNSTKRVKALIMMATEQSISAKRAIQFKIDSALNEILKACKTTHPIIDRDYSGYSDASSGFNYICNSKYWVVKTLSTFASIKKENISLIKKAYVEIIHDFRVLFSTDDVMFYRNSEPYYFFDHIQVLFNQEWYDNSSQLMNEIYDGLMQDLSDSYQFLHQKAKGKLRIAQVQLAHKHFHQAKKTLEDATWHIDRAISLAEQLPNVKNIDVTLLHMKYTKGNILIHRCRVNIKYYPEAVSACYEVYELQQTARLDLYDYARPGKQDQVAFAEFKNNLLYKKKIRKFDDFCEEKAEAILSRWCDKNIRLKAIHK